MISRAIIEEKIDLNHFRVRVPVLNKFDSSVGSTPINELAIATVCAVPGYNPSFTIGDKVFVDFEENDFSRPVIMGKIYNQNHNKSTASDGNLDSIKVSVNAELPSDTNIGTVTKQEIAQLKGLNTNIQFGFDELNSKTAILEKNLNETYGIATSNDYTEQITTLQEEIKSQQVNITNLNDEINNVDSELNNILNPLILKNISYGTQNPSSISNPKEGQIYIWIQ